MTCALRALTLCDGHVLEEPERGLTDCLCERIAKLDALVAAPLLYELKSNRRRLIEEAMASPQLPL